MQAEKQRKKRLFDATPVDDAVVAATFEAGWPGSKLGPRLKSSQNVTYTGHLHDGQKVIVRATATPGCLSRIEDELAFLRYIVAAGVRACGPIEPGLRLSDDAPGAGDIGHHHRTIVVVTRYAEGGPVVFTEWLWATDAALVEEQGRWMAQLHLASRSFARVHPQVAARIQPWDDVHDGILRGVSIAHLPSPPSSLTQDAESNAAPIEETTSSSLSSSFGVIHGDVNPSNFFVDKQGHIDVFDFDQTQRAWFLYDVAQPIWAVRMAARGGIPGLTGENAPPLDEAAFTNSLCRGYEEEWHRAKNKASGEEGTEEEKVDRRVLEDCVMLRREMYQRFCRRAKEEGDLPKDMAGFIEHVVHAFDTDIL
ncbi:APH domain-containing protein [Balamuthia mandrillaris]